MHALECMYAHVMLVESSRVKLDVSCHGACKRIASYSYNTRLPCFVLDAKCGDSARWRGEPC